LYRPIIIGIIIVAFPVPDSKSVLRVQESIAGHHHGKSGGRFFCDLLRIRHHSLNKRVAAQLFRVCNLSVDNPSLGQSLLDHNGVDVVKTVLFFFGIEPVLLNELGNPALYLRPGQLHFLRAASADNEQAVAAAIFLGQPCGGVFPPGVVFHIAGYGVLTLNIAVPRTEGGVDVRLGKRAQKFVELWCVFLSVTENTASIRTKFRFMSVNVLFRFMVDRGHGELLAFPASFRDSGNGHIVLIAQLLHNLLQPVCGKTAHFHTATSRNSAGSQVQLQFHSGGFGVLAIQFKEIAHLIQNQIVRVTFLNAVIFPHCRFRLLSMDSVCFCQRLFRLDFVILRLFLFSEIAAFLNQTGDPFCSLFPA